MFERLTSLEDSPRSAGSGLPILSPEFRLKFTEANNATGVRFLFFPSVDCFARLCPEVSIFPSSSVSFRRPQKTKNSAILNQMLLAFC